MGKHVIQPTNGSGKKKGRTQESIGRGGKNIQFSLRWNPEFLNLMDFLAAHFRITRSKALQYGAALLLNVHRDIVFPYIDASPDTFEGMKDTLNILTNQGCQGGNTERIVELKLMTDDTIGKKLKARSPNY